MTSRAIARQYALALFDVAQKDGQTDRIGRDIAEFAALVRSHEELSGVLSNSAIPAARKRAIVDALVRAQPELQPGGWPVAAIPRRSRSADASRRDRGRIQGQGDGCGSRRARELSTATPIDEPARAADCRGAWQDARPAGHDDRARGSRPSSAGSWPASAASCSTAAWRGSWNESASDLRREQA